MECRVTLLDYFTDILFFFIPRKKVWQVKCEKQSVTRIDNGLTLKTHFHVSNWNKGVDNVRCTLW